MPVVFANEWFFIIGNAFMAFTSGYFSSLGMMYAPRLVIFLLTCRNEKCTTGSVREKKRRILKAPNSVMA
ncbi:unnamed protein product [Nippostrongylus brasiliensis]|uniref:Uncharacterized protein n=1 Tax=Nippostrongylus brasiliensis TaxID=27835 RepID=A0A0N4XLH4_NIPBR|nr:unnamed protein product [Nippostrongylus brasiliensis]